jgi:hypothetical protein
MNLRVVVIVLVLFTLFLAAVRHLARSASSPQATLEQKGDDVAWPSDRSLGFPYQIALNELETRVAYPRREIFVLLRPVDFVEDRLRRLFSKLAEEYAQPLVLHVTVESDLTALQRRLEQYRREWSTTIRRGAGQTGSETAAESLHPHAVYYRGIGEGGEWFTYTIGTGEQGRVVMKEPPTPYTGNADSDLAIAAWRGDERLINSLIAGGAHVNAPDKDGDTPLINAVIGFRSDVARILIRRGADVRLKGHNGDTALHCAAAHGGDGLVNTLLDAGADINARNDDGESALGVAASWGRSSAVKLLLSRGADMETRNNRGQTLLMIAAEGGDLETVSVLLAHGANALMRTQGGQSAVDLARGSNAQRIIRLLRSAGAR